MTEVIPAILPVDFRDLTEKFSRVSGAAPLVQIDICDGKFTPQSSWPHSRHDDNFEKLVSQEEGLPDWENTDYEIDLMVADAELEIETWVQIGAKRLVLHIETFPDFGPALARIREKYGSVRDSLIAPEIGLALNIDTPNSIMEPFVADVDFVQFMGIAKPGFQGEPFDPRVLSKIAVFRAAHPDAVISVDGGVNFDTAPQLAAAGADRLVSGSAILESSNPAEAIRQLQLAGN